MAETSIISALINQAPGMGAIIVVVILFLKSIEKRDQLFINQINSVADRLAALENLLISHDKWEREAIDTIQDQQQNVITKKLKAVRTRKAVK